MSAIKHGQWASLRARHHIKGMPTTRNQRQTTAANGTARRCSLLGCGGSPPPPPPSALPGAYATTSTVPTQVDPTIAAHHRLHFLQVCVYRCGLCSQPDSTPLSRSSAFCACVSACACVLSRAERVFSFKLFALIEVQRVRVCERRREQHLGCFFFWFFIILLLACLFFSAFCLAA